MRTCVPYHQGVWGDAFPCVVSLLKPIKPSSPKNRVNPLKYNTRESENSEFLKPNENNLKPIKPKIKTTGTTGSGMTKRNRKMMIDPAKSEQGKALVAAARAARAALDNEERARLDAIHAASAVPDDCGPDIAPSPARGGFVVERQIALVPNGIDTRGLGKWAAAPTGYGHRASIRRADVFDAMQAQAARRKRPMILTPGQVAMGRRYHDLVELLSADGCVLSRLDASHGSGDGGNWMDRRIQLSNELDMLRRRIGAGVAMAVRRVRPSARGADQRGPIMDRVLVDMVCLKGCTLDQVLVAHGWAKDSTARKVVGEALCGALDRMIGYRR